MKTGVCQRVFVGSKTLMITIKCLREVVIHFEVRTSKNCRLEVRTSNSIELRNDDSASKK